MNLYSIDHCIYILLSLTTSTRLVVASTSWSPVGSCHLTIGLLSSAESHLTELTTANVGPRQLSGAAAGHRRRVKARLRCWQILRVQKLLPEVPPVHGVVCIMFLNTNTWAITRQNSERHFHSSNSFDVTYVQIMSGRYNNPLSDPNDRGVTDSQLFLLFKGILTNRTPSPLLTHSAHPNIVSVTSLHLSPPYNTTTHHFLLTDDCNTKQLYSLCIIVSGRSSSHHYNNNLKVGWGSTRSSPRHGLNVSPSYRC